MTKRSIAALSLLVLLSACGKGTDGITIGVDTINEQEKTYNVMGTIPQVQGLTNEKAQKDINALLEKIGHDLRDSFVKDLPNQHPDASSGMTSAITFGPETEIPSQHLISLHFRVMPYTAGAAHPNMFFVSFTYDVDTGKQVMLADLFKPKSNYLTVLSKLSIQKLIDLSKKKGTYYEQKQQEIKQGAGPVADNFRNFMIRNGQLVLTFDPYQVGPYAEGEQEILISRPELINILSDEGRKLLSETQQTSLK